MGDSTEANAELQRLGARNKQLAEDKSYLQLVIRLIEQINPTVGIEQMVTALLTSIVETIGGANIRLWYWLGEELCYADFLGASHNLDAIDDRLAQQAIEQGRLIEEAVDPADALLRDGIIPGAWNWAFPLLAGPQRVGVIKLEKLHLSSARLRDYLPVFLSHTALILSNEIHNVLRQQAEKKQRLAASVFTHAREGIMITDADANLVEVNDAFTRITGYAREQVLGKNPRFLQSGRHPPEFYTALWQALINTGHWTGEIWNRRRNGELFAEMLTISAVRDASGETQHYVALCTDITSLKEHQRQLEHIAHYDALTGLPNRMLLADRLQQAMAQSRRRDKTLVVVYLDLDGFKAVNDTHGHDMGDQLLVTLAQRMKAALRECDTLARIGGDEFVAVLVDLNNTEDCILALKRLLRAAADPVTVRGQALSVSASIGVTHYPADAADADQLVRHADQAMYQAKQAGKNRWHVFDIQQDTAIKTRSESLDLRRGLDTNEFVLYYQPKVNMKSGAVIGAEALIRWRHPERGLLPPAQFLPLIEDHSLSAALDEWVLDHALTQMARWREQGLTLSVSVNVGARLLQQLDFVERLREQVARYPDLLVDYLEIEVLETSALEDMTRAAEVMYACREIGVRFALDDFGTGYASLTYLRRLPADLIKIDQSFVRNMLDDPNDLAIVNGVVGLAMSFHRQVIAEGVETVAHGELLLSLGCEWGQGYGIARPMPAGEMPAWVASWRPDPRWTAWREGVFRRDDLGVLIDKLRALLENGLTKQQA